MTEFRIPTSALQAAREGKCRSQCPDNWTVECQHDQHGPEIPHRNNMVIWNDPAAPDLERETERWQAGRVLLFDDVEPDLGETAA